MEQQQHRQKRLRLESQSDIQVDGDALKTPFETLFTLVQEVREMKVQLGLLAADFTAKQELVGGCVGISQGLCRLCHSHACGRAENNNFETESTCGDYDRSQLP